MYLLAAQAGKDPMIITVVLMGLITVFVVLICLIGIIKLMGLVMERVAQRQAEKAAQAVSASAAAAAAAGAPPAGAPLAQGNNQRLVAAIATVLAEEMGEEVERLRIHSIRRL